MKHKKIYVASSWRNMYQPEIVKELRKRDHKVYDFRNPVDGETGFAWSDIDPEWRGWDSEAFTKALSHKIAVDGFNLDFQAMMWADTCVLLLPCGRSAHLEGGFFAGQGKKELHIVLMGPIEPELMYNMADHIYTSKEEMLTAFGDKS
jgi:hypothetical protein